MIKNLKKIIFILFILIMGYGIGYNINHYISLNKTITYNFNSKDLKELKNTKSELEDIMNNIENLDDSKFSEEDLDIIKNDFDIIKESINNMSFWKLEGNKKLNINDLYLIKEQIYSLPTLQLNSLIKIRERYMNDNYEELSNALFIMHDLNSKRDMEEFDKSFETSIDLSLTQSEKYLITYINYVKYLGKWVENYGGDTNA